MVPGSFKIRIASMMKTANSRDCLSFGSGGNDVHNNIANHAAFEKRFQHLRDPLSASLEKNDAAIIFIRIFIIRSAFLEMANRGGRNLLLVISVRCNCTFQFIFSEGARNQHEMGAHQERHPIGVIS